MPAFTHRFVGSVPVAESAIGTTSASDGDDLNQSAFVVSVSAVESAIGTTSASDGDTRQIGLGYGSSA